MTPPPLLVLRALGLGDLLCAVPALRALRAAHPDRELLLAAPAGLAPLVALIGTAPARPPRRAGARGADGRFIAGDRVVDRLLPLPAAVGGVPPGRAGAARLPCGAVAVNLHGDGPESHRLLLATAPSELLAFAHPDVPESAGGPPARDLWRSVSPRGTQAASPPEHERERWCRLLRAYGIAADPEALGLAPPPAPPAPFSTGAPTARAGPAAPPAAAPLAPGTTLVHPGAASAARRWPAERWAAVARAERDAGRPVAISGSAAERPLAQEIADRTSARPASARSGAASHAGASGIAVLAGTTTDLLALTRLVAAAGRVICGDSGVAHLATALGTPSVVLFGPTSPAVWGPPPDRPQHVVLWHPHAGERDVAPGDARCPGAGDPHADRPDPALLAIEADEVIAATTVLAAGDRATQPSRAARRSHFTASTAP